MIRSLREDPIWETTRSEIVDDMHLVATQDARFYDMRAYKARTTRYNYFCHFSILPNLRTSCCKDDADGLQENIEIK